MSDYTHSNASITSSNLINPVYSKNEKLTEDYIHKIITDDVLSITASKGKIPIADPSTGQLDSSWLGIDPDTTYAVEANTERKGIIEIATNSEAITGTDTERAVTPSGVKSSIDNAFQNIRATTSQSGTVILSNTIDTSQDKAVTPYAVRNYLSSSNFARADYNVIGTAPFASTSDVASIINNSKTLPINSLKNDSRYKISAVDPYSLYNYISNNDLYLNVNKQSIGGIVFRDLTEDTSGTTVTATERARLYVNKDSGNTYLKVNGKTATLLDSFGNMSIPTSIVTPSIKNSSDKPPSLGTKTIGNASKPIYLNNGVVTECNTIDNVNNATTASKLSNTAAIGSTAKPVYFTSGGVPAAISDTVGSTDTPVYLSSGTITTTGKKFSDYLPLAGGTITGPIFKNDSSITNGKVNVLWGQVGANDQWSIRAGATASDVGYLELATGDNGNDPIYIRQYAANLSNLTATPSRTATILDASGNTLFPGSVTASSFVGNVTGTSKNVTGTVAIANGGTGATTRLAAAKNLTNESVGTEATHFVTLTTSWGKFGYSTVANVKSVLGLSGYLPLAGGTMTGNITRSISSATRGTAPSSNLYNSSYVKDSKGNSIGCIETKYATNKTSSTALYAYNTTAATGNNIGSIGIGCDTNGAVYTWAPTPASGDNSTKIATTAFVKGLLSNSGADNLFTYALTKEQGYIKFKNGFIIEWNTGTSNYTWNFPVKVSIVFYAGWMPNDHGYTDHHMLMCEYSTNSITTTSLKIPSTDPQYKNVRMIMIGKV